MKALRNVVDSYKQKYKKKYKKRYAPYKKKARVQREGNALAPWAYKNPRKAFNRAFRWGGGGVSPLFHLPRE